MCSDRKKLTSHWVEAAQCVQVPRWCSCCLLKELQIKLDITPKNKTRVRVRAGSAFWEKLHHTTARAPSQGEFPLPMHHTVTKHKENSPYTLQPEHHHSENPHCPCILQPKQQHNAFLTQHYQCRGKFIANTPRQKSVESVVRELFKALQAGLPPLRIWYFKPALRADIASQEQKANTIPKPKTHHEREPTLLSLSTAAMTEISSLSSEARGISDSLLH